MENYNAGFAISFLKLPPVSLQYLQLVKENAKKKIESCCLWTSLEPGTETVDTWDHFIEGLELTENVKTAYRWHEIDASPVSTYILKTFLVLFCRCSYQTVARPPLPEDVQRELQKQVQYRLLAEPRPGTWRDVFLLEDQNPLHILAKAWMSMPELEDRRKEKALHLFNSLLKTVVTVRYLQLLQNASKDGKQVSKSPADKCFVEYDHLLDCFHYVVCYSTFHEGDKPPPVADEKALSPANTIPSAAWLRKAGICLKPDDILRINQTRFDETFRGDGPVLHVPRLCISDQTESLLRNLAVFEMVSCSSCRKVGPRRSAITSFLVLMYKLIQSKEDVELIRKDDIVISCLGSNGEMIEMWNMHCKRFSLCQSSQWTDMLTQLTTNYEYYAEFRAKSFERPQVVACWVAGVVLLGLTSLQLHHCGPTALRITINQHGSRRLEPFSILLEHGPNSCVQTSDQC